MFFKYFFTTFEFLIDYSCKCLLVFSKTFELTYIYQLIMIYEIIIIYIYHIVACIIDHCNLLGIEIFKNCLSLINDFT